MNFCLLKNVNAILNPPVSDKNEMEILLQLSFWECMVVDSVPCWTLHLRINHYHIAN